MQLLKLELGQDTAGIVDPFSGNLVLWYQKERACK